MKQKAIFLCNPNLCDLVSSFTDSLESLATESKTQEKKNFLHTQTPKKD